MVLMILANIGQISQNIVSRHIYYVNIDAGNIQNAVAANANAPVNNIFAGDQASPLLTNAGLRTEYYWGLYSECGGVGVSGARACSDNHFGNRFQPVQVFQQDAPQGLDVNQILPSGVITDSDYLGKFTHAAFYLIFIGTILAGLAFLVGVTANRVAFLLAAILSLAAAACLAAGAGIWTAIIAKSRSSVNGSTIGVTVNYGNALWFTWASFAATAVAFPFLIISCCVGRDKY